MKIKFILTAVAITFALSISAQEEKTYPHAFVSAQGGLMRAYNGDGIDRKWNPMAAVSVGYNFTDVFGLRLQANGSTWKADLGEGQEYKSKIGNIDLDMLFNLSNVLFPNRNNFVNVIAIAGAPFNFAIPHAWVDNYAFATTEGSDRWNRAWKVGGMLDFNITRNWSFNLEGGTNYIRQSNSAVCDNNKWWPYAMAGITYKFCGKKKPKMVEVEETYYVDEPYTETIKKQRPVEATEAKTVKKMVYYLIRESKAEEAEGIDAAIKDAADLFKTDPNAKITVTGYADKETGNAKINMQLSQERAEGVTAKLVNEHGINAANITTTWKGDTEQPFADNDKNRCVIIEGKGTFKVTKYEDYEEKVEKTRQVAKTRMVTVEKK